MLNVYILRHHSAPDTKLSSWPIPVTGVQMVLLLCLNGETTKQNKMKPLNYLANSCRATAGADGRRRLQLFTDSFHIRCKQLLESFDGLLARVSGPHHRFCLNTVLSAQAALLQIKMSFQTTTATRELRF